MGVVRWVSGPVPRGVWGMVRRRLAAAVQAGPDTTQPPTPCPHPLAAPVMAVTCPHGQLWLALQVPPEIVRFRQWDRRRPSRSHPLHSFQCARGLAMSGEAMIGRLAPYLGTIPRLRPRMSKQDLRHSRTLSGPGRMIPSTSWTVGLLLCRNTNTPSFVYPRLPCQTSSSPALEQPDCSLSPYDPRKMGLPPTRPALAMAHQPRRYRR